MKPRLLKGDTFSSDDDCHPSWHDVALHGIAVWPEAAELRLDVDYLVEWPGPPPARDDRFLIAPCTVVFSSARKFRFSVETIGTEIWLKNIVCVKPERLSGSSWQIRTLQGAVELESTGWRLFCRADPVPVYVPEQRLTTAARGGVRFDGD